MFFICQVLFEEELACLIGKAASKRKITKPAKSNRTPLPEEIAKLLKA